MELTLRAGEVPTSGPVLITGAGGGIGVSLAEVLLDRGCRSLLFHYRTRCEELTKVVTRYGLDPARTMFCADLTDEQQVAQMHRRIQDLHGPLFGLVNLAGSSSNGLSWKLSKQEFQQIVDTNLLTTFLCCRQFIPEMREQARGRIINVSSVVAFIGAAGAAHYCAAKAAVAGFTRAVALELAPKNIVVSAVALGYFQYGLIHSIPHDVQEQIRRNIPSRRFGNSQEFGGLILYLLSDAGAYSGGQIYHLNGGLYS